MSMKKNNPEKDSQEYIDTWNNAHIITTRTLRYIQLIQIQLVSFEFS